MPAVYIDRSDLDVGYANGCLLLRSPDRPPQRLPLAQIDFMLLRANNRIDGRVLCHLAEQGATVLLLDGRGMHRPAQITGYRHGSAARRLAQYQLQLDHPWRLQLSRALVSAKLHSQHRLLRQAMAARPDQRYPLLRTLKRLREGHQRLQQATGLDPLRGIEGAAAAAYFEAYAHILPAACGFDGRNRRPPRDPVNALLSLGYTLLMAEAVNALHRTGLDPQFGVYHDLAHNRDSLACDLIEPERTHVDQQVWRLFAERQLGPHDFETLNGACRLKKAGRTTFYRHYEATAPAVRQRLQHRLHRIIRSAPQLSADAAALPEPWAAQQQDDPS